MKELMDGSGNSKLNALSIRNAGGDGVWAKVSGAKDGTIVLVSLTGAGVRQSTRLALVGAAGSVVRGDKEVEVGVGHACSTRKGGAGAGNLPGPEECRQKHQRHARSTRRQK